MKKLTIVLTVIILLSACGGATPMPAADVEIDYIERVQSFRAFNASNDISASFGDVVNRFIDAPSWNYDERDDGASVEMRGRLQSDEVITVTTRVTITQGGIAGLSWPSANIDGVAISGQDDVRDLLLPLFEAYERGDETVNIIIPIGQGQELGQESAPELTPPDPSAQQPPAQQPQVTSPPAQQPLAPQPSIDTGNNDTSITFGSTFRYLGIEYTIGDSWRIEDPGGFIYIPVSISNISNADNSPNSAGIRLWSPNGLSIFGGFGTILPTSMRAGASLNTHFIFEDHGDGVYVIEFYEMFVSDIDVVITLPIIR